MVHPDKLRAAVLTLLLAGASTAIAEDTSDPWQPLNRNVQGFNDFADEWAVRPALKVYHGVLPDPVEGVISNFFDNLAMPGAVINSLLQGKGNDAIDGMGRFVTNSTLGLAGLFDVATPLEIGANLDEDVGQTLGAWGVGSGPYVVLPLLGPSNVRDAFGLAAGLFLNPVGMINDEEVRYGTAALQVIDLRAGLEAAEGLISGDRYLFLRDVYSQRREYLILDGAVEDDFADDF